MSKWGTYVCVLCESYKPNDGRAGAPQGVEQFDTYTVDIECPRCGRYSIRRDMPADYPRGLPEELGLRLSAVARIAADEKQSVTITHENYQELAKSAPSFRSYAARVEWLLLLFARYCQYPGRLTPQLPLEPIAAWVCLPLNACDALLFQMADERLIVISNRDPLRYQATLGPAGWARVDALQASRPHFDKAFVAMAFAPELKTAYDAGIRKALEDCGYVAPFRVDDSEHDTQVNEAHFKQRIDDRIMAELQRAGLVIVDVTLARPAVYFEAGFAQGLGTRIIWTCREANEKTDLCFDTRQTGHILWTDPADLRTKLTNRIRAYGWHPKP